MDRKPRIISHLTWIAIMNLLLLCTLPVRACVNERVQNIDAHEGSTVQLHCRFPPPRENVMCLWMTNINNDLHVVTINNYSLLPSYKVYMNLKEGRCDLQIRNASYEQNNGEYKCELIKVGIDFYKYINPTMLRTPDLPTIYASVTEGHRLPDENRKEFKKTVRKMF